MELDMAFPKLFASAGLVTVLTLSAAPSALAQHRGTAVPRGSVRVYRPSVVAPRVYGPRYYGYRSYGYYPRVNLSFFYGRPGFYGAYAYGNPFYAYGYPYYYPGYAYPAYGYGYSAPYGYGSPAPYGYGYGGYSGRPYGGLRIDLPQRDAEVFVDGYFVGTVDNFDGVLQQANLEAGPHRVEIRSPEFETIEFNVNIEPGRTITYRGSMRELRP
jgi:hypothetical protein